MMHNWCCILLKRSMILLLSAVVSADIITMFVVAESTAVVNTTSGPVRGEILATFNSVKYASFLGIRYGKAPVGYHRFKPPVAAEPWTEIFDATDDGEPCMQYNASRAAITGSEDCLFLNVYTPVVDLAETPQNLKSVILWVYGGAFLTGSSSSKTDRPDYFLNNDIVYVSLNYRNGMFGYLALRLANATGNAGMKDVVLGLKWIKANIKQFGGNPNNVTLLGGSSGGAVIDYLMLSDSAAGLFHGTITMSGSLLSSWAFQTPAKALFQAEKLAGLMGITWTDRETLLQAFYNAPAEEIVNATRQMGNTFGPFTPTIEDESIATDVFLSRCSMDKFTTGNFSKVPHMLGWVDQETVTFISDIGSVQDLFNECFNAAEQLNLTLSPTIMSAYDALYSSNFSETINYAELRNLINDSSDLLYIAPIDQMQKILAANDYNNPVYYYHFSYSVPGPHHVAPTVTLPGAGHGDDLRFIFHVPMENYTNDPVANFTVRRMSTMWSNFVKYGNPTPDWLDDKLLNFTWPDSGPLGLSLNIGWKLIIEPRPISKYAKSLEKRTWPHLREAKGCDDLPNSLDYKVDFQVNAGHRRTPGAVILPLTFIAYSLMGLDDLHERVMPRISVEQDLPRFRFDETHIRCCPKTKMEKMSL